MFLLLTVSIVLAKTFGEHNCGGVAFFQSHLILYDIHCTKKMKFSSKNFFSKCDQIRRKMENFIFCAVIVSTLEDSLASFFLPLPRFEFDDNGSAWMKFIAFYQSHVILPWWEHDFCSILSELNIYLLAFLLYKCRDYR